MFRQFRYLPFLVLTTAILFTACDSLEEEGFSEIPVVESYMIAGRPLPFVKLSATVPANEEYVFEEAALGDANVIIYLLSESGEEEDIFRFTMKQKGIYLPENRVHRVLPGRTYQLEVTFDERDDQLNAVTTIPGDLKIINEVPEFAIYQSENQPELVVTNPSTGNRQNVFVINTISFDPVFNNLTPFYMETVTEDDALEVEDFVNNDSPLINEGNFEVNADGTITIKYPWIGVAFFGENRVVVNSIDSNLNDLLRSQSVQLGGSTISPGEIQNVIFHVDGGIGIFGGIASDSVNIFFERPPGM